MTAEGSTPRIPVEERLFSLVLALLATDSGLTKNEILSTVQGYGQKFSHSGDIRELGVPLETIDSPGQAGNNQNLRYRIPRGAYELPSDITFSPEETTLLNLAAMVWREGSISEQSRRAIIKLRSLGVATTEPVLGYAPRVRVRDAAFEPLSGALEKHQVVRFAYLKPGEAEASVRTVSPLALVQHQGRWHLYADDSGARKTFLLRRIVSQVTTLATTFPAPPADTKDRALLELEDVWDRNTAIVEVEPGTDAATRLRRRRGSSVTASGALELHYSDANIVADELASFGPEALVVSPPELREAVRSRLERTADDHG